MKILAVDYGDARTGIAISDLLCSIVGSTTVIHSRNQDKTVDEILRLVKEKGGSPCGREDSAAASQTHLQGRLT